VDIKVRTSVAKGRLCWHVCGVVVVVVAARLSRASITNPTDLKKRCYCRQCVAVVAVAAVVVVGRRRII